MFTKTSIAYLRSIVSLTAIFISMSLFSQNSGLFLPDHRIVEGENKKEISIFFGANKDEYQSEKTLGTDTLFIQVNNTLARFLMVGPTYNVHKMDIEWITNDFGYLILNSADEFDIAASLRYYFSKQYIILKTGFSFNANDTLKINSGDTEHKIFFKPVDKNGVLFEQLPGYTSNDIDILVPQGMGYAGASMSAYANSSTYISEIPESFTVICSSMYSHIESNEDIYFVEFPPIDIVKNHIILNNSPDEYKLANFECFATYDTISPMYASVLSGMIYNDRNGQIWGFAGGMTFEIETNRYWNGKIYIHPHEYAEGNPVVLLHYATGLSPYEPRCLSPSIEIVNDSIFAYTGVVPTYNIYKTSVGDTLRFGESPVTQYLRWINNNPENAIFASLKNNGQLREFLQPVYGFSEYDIFDADGTLIGYGNGDLIYLGNREPGLYSVRINNPTGPFFQGEGISQLISFFNFGSQDASPPTISPVQFRNADGKQCIKVNTGEALDMYFDASDFNDVNYDTAMYLQFQFEYQAVIDDSTQVLIREHGTSEWTEVIPQNIHEDSISGICYKANLSAFTDMDSAYLDVKIRVVDYNGNSSTYFIAPAIGIGDDISLIVQEPSQEFLQEEISVFPNPSLSQFTIVLPEKMGENSKMTIYNLGGQQFLSRQITEQQTVVDVSGLPAGVYLIKLEDGKQVAVGKMVKK